jgi:LytS/YehU family sensor histidine kinase
VLENSDQNLVTLEKELYSLQLYVDLEKLRMDMAIDYRVKIDDAITDPSQIKIPPLILQPFVENALWHGLSTKDGQKIIQLIIYQQPGWLICEITDNGIGRKKAAEHYQVFPEGHLSKALGIIRQRLSDFNQSKDKEPVSFIDLEERGQPTGTTVIVRIRTQ